MTASNSNIGRKEKPAWLVHRQKAMRLTADEPRRCDASGALLERLAIRSRSEVAVMMGLTRHRIYQIERMAIYKIRRALKSHMAELKDN